MVNLQIYKYWRIVGKDGKVRYTKRRKCRSFVKQFGQILSALMAHSYGVNGDAVTVKDTSNTDQTVSIAIADVNQYLACEAPSANSTYGMQVGTGITAPTILDYVVETLIAHGVGAGQLSYANTIVNDARVEGSSVKFLIQRAFSNNSGNPITVRESTLVCEVSSAKYYLLIHEAENQAIANGETGTLFYDFVMTV